MKLERIVDVVLEVQGRPTRGRPVVAVAVSLSVLATAALALSTLPPQRRRPVPPPPSAPLQVVEVVSRPKPPPPPVEVPPTPAPQSPRGPAKARDAQATAAPAAQVLTAAADAPVDLTDEVIIVGTGTQWLGGVTRVDGTATEPGREPGPSVAAERAAPGLSRPVGLLDPEWGCPWPAAHLADDALREMTAVVQVLVRPDGTASAATIVDDPGLGFGEAARACALASSFEPALDALGQPVLARSAPIRVRFWR